MKIDLSFQNLVAGRKSRSLLKIVNVVLIHSNLPLSFWEETLYNACYISNSILHKNQNKIR